MEIEDDIPEMKLDDGDEFTRLVLANFCCIYTYINQLRRQRQTDKQTEKQIDRRADKQTD